MRRTFTAAMASAAVLGAAAGGLTALQLTGGSSQAAGRSPGTVTDERSGQPLWATADEIHDGDTVVPVDLPDLDSVRRTASGWLATTRTSPQEPVFTAWAVDRDGATREIGSIFGYGDLDDDRQHFIAMPVEGGGYTVWDVATGEETDHVDHGVTEEVTSSDGNAGFAGDRVVSSWVTDDGVVQVSSYRPSTGERIELDVPGYDWVLSNDGRTIAANLLGDGSEPTCAEFGGTANAKAADRTSTCEAQLVGRTALSPSGRQVLLFANRPDGGADTSAVEVVPTALEAGFPSDPAVLRLPDLGEPHVGWVDEERVLVTGVADGGDADVVEVCSVDDGSCQEVGTTTSTVVVGTV